MGRTACTGFALYPFCFYPENYINPVIRQYYKTLFFFKLKTWSRYQRLRSKQFIQKNLLEANTLLYYSLHFFICTAYLAFFKNLYQVFTTRLIKKRAAPSFPNYGKIVTDASLLPASRAWFELCTLLNVNLDTASAALPGNFECEMWRWHTLCCNTMHVCVCNRRKLHTADGVDNTCGFPHDISPTATAVVVSTKSGCLFTPLNDAINYPTDAHSVEWE